MNNSGLREDDVDRVEFTTIEIIGLEHGGLQDGQKGRPARPQQVKRRGVRSSVR